MFNLNAITSKNDDKKWPYRLLIIRPSGSGKTNTLLNLIQKQNNDRPIDKIYLYAKDLSEPKYQFLIKKCDYTGIKYLNVPSGSMDDVYNNIDDYNPNRKRKILIVFDVMIADIMSNKRFHAIIKKLFIRCRKLNISLVFITHSYFIARKEVKLNSIYYLIKKIHKKRELQNIATNHSADIDCKDFLKIYRNCTKEPYSFMTIHTALRADNPMRFRKNFSDSLL